MAGTILNTLRAPVAGQIDHDWYAHRRLSETPDEPWLGRHAVAAFFLIRLQTMALSAPAICARDPRWSHGFGNFTPDYRTHSLMEYGNRIGIYRLLDMLEPLGWKVAVSVNGLVAKQNPALIRSLANRGVEIVMSSWSAAHMIGSDIPPDVERHLLGETFNAIADALGGPPTAYASQDYGYSPNTAERLSELGLSVAVDWPNDEVPFLFGADRRLLMLPAAAEMEDAQMIVGRRLQSPVWAAHLHAGLTYMSAHAHPGSVLALPLHAWIAGAPHRFTNLRKCLQQVDAKAFWQAGPSDIEHAWRIAH